ncbi:MAG TPA: serine hydrolase domain-containing protein [Rhabdochlamydiaceae bacterium]|nr:serine hydrolase domain-containing protein [Rhabdochlamydiaceae bacterium]
MASIPGSDPKRRIADPLSATIETRLTALARDLPKLVPSFSGVIAFQSGDGPIVQVCHPEGSLPTDPIFNVYSIGKLFTAAAILQLIEDGIRGDKKISLDTKLSDLLTPEECNLVLREPYESDKPTAEALKAFAEHAGEITLRQLLSHTAGFSGMNWSQDQVGKRTYSNYGYQLLARIIGKHSKEYGNPQDYETSFRTYIEKRIFERSGMDGAIHELHAPEGARRPRYFRVLENGSREEVKEPEPYPHGNGCWRMRARDLLLFAKALRHHLVLNEPSYQALLKLGFMSTRDSVQNWGHPGQGMGQSTFLQTWLTNPPITAVMLSENSNAAELLYPVMNKEFNKD